MFWDGQQRGGTIHGVPYRTAMDWLRKGWASVVLGPVGAGAASNPARIEAGQDTATTAHLTSASDDLRRATPTTTHSGVAEVGVEALDRASTAPRLSATFGLYESQEIGPEASQYPRETPADLRKRHNSEPVEAVRDPYEQPDEPVRSTAEPVRQGVRSPRNPYGPGRCGNCGSDVSGRRRWCSEACRLQAYRERR